MDFLGFCLSFFKEFSSFSMGFPGFLSVFLGVLRCFKGFLCFIKLEKILRF